MIILFKFLPSFIVQVDQLLVSKKEDKRKANSFLLFFFPFSLFSSFSLQREKWSKYRNGYVCLPVDEGSSQGLPVTPTGGLEDRGLHITRRRPGVTRRGRVSRII